MKHGISLLFMIGSLLQLAAQEVVFTHFVSDSGVALRWYPANQEIWKRIAESGVKINRKTIARDGKILSNSENTELKTDGLKLNTNWVEEQIRNGNSTVGFINEVLNHETKSEFHTPESLSSLVQDQNNGFLFSILLLRADINSSIHFGLATTDPFTSHNEVYIYELFRSGLHDTLRMVVRPAEPDQVAPPSAPELTNSESGVEIHWTEPANSDIACGFYIERSLDHGKTFGRIHPLPIFYGFSKTSTGMYLDTFKSISSVIQYRFSMFNTFGYDTICSVPALIQNFENVLSCPIELKFNSVNGESILTWKMDNKQHHYTDSFSIWVADSMFGEPRKCLNVEGHANATAIAELTGYYSVIAHYRNNRSAASAPLFIQFKDTIAPFPPANVLCYGDTSGNIILTWNTCNATDFLGFQVYRSWFQNSEFHCITPKLIKDTFILDSISTGWKRDSVYYYIHVFDNHYNENISEIVSCKVKHAVPPQTPVIRLCRQKNMYVELQWTGDGGSGIHHQVLRAEEGESPILLAVVNNYDGIIIDSTINPGKSYRYTIQSVNSWGLKSKESVHATIQTETLNYLPRISLSQVYRDSAAGRYVITWEKPAWQVSHYRIQGMVMGKWQTLSTLNSTAESFVFYTKEVYKIPEKMFLITAYSNDGRRSMP